VSLELRLISYPGECGSGEGICIKQLEVNVENIQGDREDPTCRKVESDCFINYKIRNFQLIENGKIDFQLSEDLSMSSGIYLKIESSSSIPDEISSISDVINSDMNFFFRGSTPSTFSYLMTPSLFRTDSNKWEDNQIGYHISTIDDPYKGSQTGMTE
jgi:hypothetical protein